jgi:hypothetical protein
MLDTAGCISLFFLTFGSTPIPGRLGKDWESKIPNIRLLGELFC